MLLEEGFTVTSVDASDKMLKQAHKTRWNRRKEEKFDEWGMFYSAIISLYHSFCITLTHNNLKALQNYFVMLFLAFSH